MTKLDELIKEYCPNGVEYKTLGEVCNYEQPNKYIVESTDYKDEYETPVLTAGQTFVLGYTNETNGIYQANDKNPVIIFDDFTGALKWVNFPFKVKSSAMKILTSKNKNVVILRYIFFCMENFNFYSTEHKRLWITNYSNFQIPVPPLAVQEEIVCILDKFTSLTAELTAELTARRAQYEYYRDALLTPPFSYGYKEHTDLFEANLSADRQDGTHGKERKSLDLSKSVCEYKKLGEISISISSGKNKSKSNDGEFIVYGSTGPIAKTDKWVYDKEQILIARVGANAGFVYKANGKYDVSDNTIIVNVKDDYNLQYIYYSLKNMNLHKYAKGGGQPLVTAGELKEITIPLPPLPVQKRIVDVLDNFDAICSGLKIGLPAEIDARKKQYEYYRDLLLNFGKYNQQ